MNALPRVMAVDDEEAVTSIIIEFFEEEGFTAKGYNEARLALTALDNGNFVPDVILVDIMMPTMDGYEFCRRVQTNPQLMSIPVVFLTGKDREDDSLSFLESGGHLYVKKPFNLDELKAIVLLAYKKALAF